MKNKIILPIIVSVVALAALFLLSVNGFSNPKKKTEKEQAMGPMNNSSVVAAKFEDLLSEAKNKLHPDLLKAVESLEAELKAATTDSQKIAINEALGKKWMETKRPAIASEYFSQSGILENSEKKLTFASHLIYEGLQTEEDLGKRKWMSESAERSLNKVLEINPNNTEAKIDLANILIEGKGMVMEGIAKLQEIVSADSSNFPANLTLGKMAIQSNQLDKAIERSKLILKYHPDSWEARILMAEAFVRKGDKENAVKYLTEAKKYNNSPEFGKDVDEYIKNIQ